ncbi:helix-turn-helix domain-containing protein [Paenibacillus oralis]|uniref:helix-turn-helix domain-containing protein n=1 Tax=Paenibacillus oralis TaxID=2490856 RepID=UPI001FE59DF8|nr:helix-turn-helix transcriptional regulator [Paenibacillus oralis]
MISTTTIRAELEDYIKKEGTTLHRFAEVSGVNVGTLSGIINGNRPIAVGQLDRITKAMGLSEGYFYDLYVDECFVPSAPHWRRLRPFFMRCAELGRHDCIQEVLNQLLEDLKQVAGIFETAERMFEQGFKEAAVILYESVIESERSSHSERLAMCYYRLFKIHHPDSSKGFKAAMQFLTYRHRLPEVYALDGILMLVEVYSLKFNWIEAEAYADELCRLAKALYEKKVWRCSDFKPLRPLVYYYGKGYLMKSGTYEYRGMFEESKKWIAEYADLSWFEGDDETQTAVIEQFKMFAKVNHLCVDIKSGDRSKIPKYVQFLEEEPDEVIEGLITLIESANRHQFFIDDVLDHFSEEIKQYRLFGKDKCFSEAAVSIQSKEPSFINRCSVFFQNYAIYNLRKGNYEEAIKSKLYSLKIAIALSGFGYDNS